MEDKQRRRADREAGFSLMEVLVAMIILTIGLLSLARMMVTATQANSLSGERTATAALAKETMEMLKAVPFYTSLTPLTVSDALQPGGDLDANNANYSQYYDEYGGPSSSGDAHYVVRWQIVDLNPGLAAGPLAMRRITVRSIPFGNYEFTGEATFTTFRTANVNAATPGS